MPEPWFIMLEPTTCPPLPTPKADRAIGTGNCAHFERRWFAEVQNDSNISGRVVWIDSESHDSARIINAERRDKEASGRAWSR